MTQQQLQYFDNMEPGQIFIVKDAQNPSVLIQAAKEYIDAYGCMQFNADYSVLTKLNPIPKTDEIRIFISTNY
ncbi:hypothetical protein WAE58_21610 [Pedobacter panaciterrae]|uniref:Uncharacterized protein n=1 Tax=Pedobacter panaciterrae TaxID=363849 RepID=A0ABU8NUA8_9SPHI